MTDDTLVCWTCRVEQHLSRWTTGMNPVQRLVVELFLTEHHGAAHQISVLPFEDAINLEGYADADLWKRANDT